MTAPHTLAAAGLALYGPGWRAALAAELDVDPRRVRRWANGTAPLPGWLWERLGEIAERRLQRVADLRERLERRAAA